MAQRLTDAQLRGACFVHCHITSDADFAFVQQFLQQADVCELFSDVDTAAQHMQVLSLKMACDVVGKAAQSLMEARDRAMLAELAAVQAFERSNEHPQHLLDRYYEGMPRSWEALLAKALLAAVLWRTRQTQAAEEDAAAAANVMAQ